MLRSIAVELTNNDCLQLEHELKSTVIHEDLIKRREVHVQELKSLS